MKVSYSLDKNLVLRINASYDYYIFDIKVELICGKKLVIYGYPPNLRIWYCESF
jgi:hypothetical protein